MDVYVFNHNLQRIGVVDTYKSLIWAKRYADIGDCELYVEANKKYMDLLKRGYYLIRDDDDMICRIEKIELDTDAENGNYLIVVASDCKKILDQRIMWNQSNFKGKAEVYARALVTNHFINPTIADRKISNMRLGTLKGFTESIDEQNSYINIGEKIREFCTNFKWGYKITLDSGNFVFDLYKGVDRSSTVVFSNDYENISSTKYVDDGVNLGTYAVVMGEGEGSDRERNESGSGTGIDRWEIYVDAKDISKNVTYADLREMWSNGTVVTTGSAIVYRVPQLDIQIFDNVQLAELQRLYPTGTIVTVDGIRYYRLTNKDVATLESATPDDNTKGILQNLVYKPYLLGRGYEKLSAYGEKITFEGTVNPETTFVYNQDYFLGDVVKVENEYGISKNVRITEVIEVVDDNGYSVQPKFE